LHSLQQKSGQQTILKVHKTWTENIKATIIGNLKKGKRWFLTTKIGEVCFMILDAIYFTATTIA
jgi:hypothetical protein